MCEEKPSLVPLPRLCLSVCSKEVARRPLKSREKDKQNLLIDDNYIVVKTLHKFKLTSKKVIFQASLRHVLVNEKKLLILPTIPKQPY